jgi:phosphoribosylamine--glycine ligase
MAGEFRAVPSTIDDPEGLLEVAVRERIDLAVVGPELPLSLGVADRFTAAGRLVFGPTAAAAQLESSKAFAKAFMARHGIPTARFRTCQSLADALDAVRSGEFGFPVVLKADGLAAGKGVVIATDLREAEAAARAAMAEGRFGAAGACLVVEECLEGPEVSFFAIADRERAVAIGTAQDHKRIFDHDLGPNTGGMGAFAPSPLITPALHASIMRTVIDPVVAGLASEGIPYCGFLYAGLMLTGDGPKVIEFNARLGDPEAQVLLPLLADPLAPLLHAAAQGTLRATSCEWLRETSVGVVLASRGYPESSESGHEITGIAEAERLAGVSVCQAGTALRDGRLVTAGGRVLTVVGRAVDYPTAIARAYEGVSRIAFDGMQFRRDIGRKALAPL